MEVKSLKNQIRTARAGFSVKSSYVQNLLLQTSRRFFAQSEPNQCRKILLTVNINNYQKKEILTHCRNGPQKRSKVEGQFYEKGYNS